MIYISFIKVVIERNEARTVEYCPRVLVCYYAARSNSVKGRTSEDDFELLTSEKLALISFFVVKIAVESRIGIVIYIDGTCLLVILFDLTSTWSKLLLKNVAL